MLHISNAGGKLPLIFGKKRNKIEVKKCDINSKN
jgi:hypothetical protein